MYSVIQKPLNELIRAHENQAGHLVLFRTNSRNTAEEFVRQRIAQNYAWFEAADFIIAEDLSERFNDL